MKILVDTNVLLSAALRDRLPERVVLHVAAQDDWMWIVTPEILDEYAPVLRRPKFALSMNLLEQWTALIQSRTICVSRPQVVAFPRYPKDAPFLSAAIATGAEYLITGDRHLLQAKALIATCIVTVAEFAATLLIE